MPITIRVRVIVVGGVDVPPEWVRDAKIEIRASGNVLTGYKDFEVSLPLSGPTGRDPIDVIVRAVAPGCHIIGGAYYIFRDITCTFTVTKV